MPDPTPAPSDGALIIAELRADLAAARAVDPAGKPGWRTTEFWGHAVTQLLGALIIAYGMWRGSDVLIEVGALLTGGSQVGYALARAVVKRAPAAPVP